MAEIVDFEPIAEMEWRAFSRAYDTDLAKKADAPFVFRFTDLTPPEFLARMFSSESNIFRPQDVMGVEFQAEDWVVGAVRVRVVMNDFELWFESMMLSPGDSIVRRFGNDALHGLPEHVQRNRIEVSFGTYSHWSTVSHHVPFAPTMELIDIAMEKPERWLFVDCWGDSHPPRLLKPGTCVRSMLDEPDGMYVEDIDILSWHSTDERRWSQQTLKLVERYRHVRIVRDMKDFVP